MKAIDVERIRFEFGESWTVAEKWDDSRAFLDGIGKLKGEWTDERTGELVRVGSKAVDIVGVCEGRLYLIEVKDYRGYPIETKRRQPHALPLAIACKVRDTVAGLVGAGRLGAEPWVESCARLLVERKLRVHVVAWIADPDLRAAEPIKKREVWQKERSDRLKQRLSWLTPYVTVASPFDGRVGDVTAQSLPGAGQR
ncbi:hypothetical protein AB3662_05430 [Sorangium cellulosum]|uniref:hypothetical protein n=1 Tax=Sorangium cellulosum TaxID=56 RepID=UPI003D9AAB89